MNKSIIILEGKNKDDLIKEGLAKLNKKIDEVNIEILQKGCFFGGMTIRKYKIKLEVKKSLNESEILNEASNIMDGISNYEILYREDGVYLHISGNIENDLDFLNDILNEIKIREIENYDLNIIKKEIRPKGTNLIKFAPSQKQKLIDEKIDIFISKDKMEGYIVLIPPMGGKNLNLDIALDKIKEEIKYGLDMKKINNAIKQNIYGQKICIAKGKDSVDGKDGYVRYRFNNKTNFSPEINKDGSANFRNLDLISNVKKGDILTEIIQPTKGKDGFNIIGERISHREGKVIVPKYGKNVTFTEDGLYLVSEVDGQVLLDGGKVIVNEVYEVKGDVDNSTGNIVFNGIVRVNGCVKTGFSIESKGDIEVKGVVEGATIKNDGNIIMNSGIQGYNKANIIAKGNVIAKYIENCVVHSDGMVTTEAIMHSEVFSNNIINVKGKKGLIVGGTCRATNEINANTIGSSMATVTNLEVGIDPGLKLKYEELSSKSNEIENNLDKLEKSITLLNRLANTDKLDKKKQDLLLKLINTKNQLTFRNNSLTKEIIKLNENIEFLNNGKIRVKNIIYPGVRITIGNSTMFVKEELKNCTIYRDKGEIRIGSYDL